jgi:hypothetical protein
MRSEEQEICSGNSWHALAVCPSCGHAHSFLRLPLFLVSGASGTGKTALALELARRDPRCVHLESDILWRAEFDHPEDGYRAYRNLWLNLCKNIAQSGRPVALYGSIVPDQLEPCPQRRYIGPVHTLALVCEPEILSARLCARPAWRNAGDAEFVNRMQRFNQWFLDQAAGSNPPITLLDTSRISLEEAAEVVKEWIGTHWPDKREVVIDE